MLCCLSCLISQLETCTLQQSACLELYQVSLYWGKMTFKKKDRRERKKEERDGREVGGRGVLWFDNSCWDYCLIKAVKRPHPLCAPHRADQKAAVQRPITPHHSRPPIPGGSDARHLIPQCQAPGSPSMPQGLPRTRAFVGVKTYYLPIRAFLLGD